MSTFTIGAAKITRIEETYEPNFDATWFFPDWQPDVVERHRDWMLPNHYDPASGKLKLSVHSWFLQVGGRNILIDTCVGNDKERPFFPLWHRLKTPYLDRLAQAGAKPEDVNLVLCTHLHSDHIGWNTRLTNGRWVPTFPNARYLFSRADFEHFKTIDPQKSPSAVAYKDSVAPIVEAGLADLVSGLYTVDEHLTLEPAPGHTPGTMFITLASHGARAVFCGDILHQAIQIFPRSGTASGARTRSTPAGAGASSSRNVPDRAPCSCRRTSVRRSSATSTPRATRSSRGGRSHGRRRRRRVPAAPRGTGPRRRFLAGGHRTAKLWSSTLTQSGRGHHRLTHLASPT